MLAVIQEAYLSGVSTRRVDDLVRALGIEGISKSEVSRICAGLHAEIGAFRGRTLGESSPHRPTGAATRIRLAEASDEGHTRASDDSARLPRAPL